MKTQSVHRKQAVRLVAASLILLPACLSQATTGTWNYTNSTAANLSWGYSNATTPSWTSNIIPNAVGDTALFNALNLSAGKTITLDGNRTVGTMEVDDTTTTFYAYTFNPGTPSTSQLIFDVASGSAALNFTIPANGTGHNFGVGITLNDPLVITTTKTNVNATQTFTGVITDGAGSYSITKGGSGIVAFNATNTYDGGTIINGGRIGAQVSGSYGTGGVTVASGGQAFLATGVTYPNNFSIAGTGYSNTLDAGALTGAIRYNGSVATPSTTNGTVTVTAAARIGAYNGTYGTLAGPLVGSSALEINSTGTSQNGTIIISGDASGFTGTTTVSQGSLKLGLTSNIGGSVVVGDLGKLYSDNISGTGGAATVQGNLTLGATTGATLYIDPSTTECMQVNGNVTLNGTTTVVLTGPVTNPTFDVLTYSGTLTGNASNLTLAGGLASYRPGSGFSTSTSGKITLTLITGDVRWSGATNGNWSSTLTDLNWLDGTTPTSFYNTDNVTFDSDTRAYLTTALAGANDDLAFSTVAAGTSAEGVSVSYLNPGAPGSPLAVGVVGTAITVYLGTDGAGTVISTADDVKYAIETSVEASALVTVARAPGNDGSGIPTDLASTALSRTKAVTIGSGVTVSPGDMLFDNAIGTDYSVSGSGTIGGGGVLTKTNTGALTLTTANSYAGGTNLTNGRLRVGNAAALGAGTLALGGGQFSSNSTTAYTLTNPLGLSGTTILGDAVDTGALTLSGAATLTGNTTLNVASGETIAQTLSGVITDGASSFSLTKEGATGILVLSGANTYDGGTFINAGRVNANNLSAFGTGAVTVGTGGSAYLITAGTFTNPFTLNGIGFTETAGNLGAIRLQGNTVSGPITLASNARITAHGSTGTLSGNIGETGGPVGLELSNYSTGTDSTITVSGNNSYSGGTTVKGAVVIATHDNAFGTGSVTINGNGTVARTTRVQLGTNIQIANNVIIDSNATTGTSALSSYAGDINTVSTAVVNGMVQINQSVGGGGHLASNKGSKSVLRVMGAVNAASGVSVVVRQGVVELGGGGTYDAIQVVDGTLKLAASGGLCPTSVLSIGTSGTSGDNGTFDLNGFNQSLAGLLNGARPATVINSGGSASTLTLDLANNSTYAGTFGASTAGLTVIKSGAGILTLPGTSSAFTGTLSVPSGGLDLTGTLGTTGSLVALTAGTSLSGEGTIGGNASLTNIALSANSATVGALSVGGNLDVSAGTVTVTLQGTPSALGPVKIVGFGTLSGNGSNFSLVNSSNYRSPVFTVGASSVDLTVASADLTWTGSSGSAWDLGVTPNWVDGSSTPSNFLFLDNVTFNDDPLSDQNVSIPGNVMPGSVTFTNATRNYDLTGAGTLAAVTITKSGAGQTVIEAPLTVGGPITLTNGTLRCAPTLGVTDFLAGAISGTGTLAKSGDGALSVGGNSPSFAGQVVVAKGELIAANSGAFGTGTVTFGDATTAPTDTQKLTISTGVSIPNPVVVGVTALDATVAGAGAISGTATLTKKGLGLLKLQNPNTFTGATTIVGGTLRMDVPNASTALSSSSTVTLGTAATGATEDTILQIGACTDTSGTATCASPVVVSSAAPATSKAVLDNNPASNIVAAMSGTVTLQGGRPLWIRNSGQILWQITGKISGTGDIYVDNTDYNHRTRLMYSGNDFTGNLYLVTGGIQVYNGAGGSVNCIPNTTDVIFSAGTTLGMGTSDTMGVLIGGAADPAHSLAAAIVKPNTSGAGTFTITVGASNHDGVYDGTIADESSSHALAFTKTGTGTQTLNGAGSYTGTTNIIGGTIAVGNDTALGTGAVNLNVATGTIRCADSTPHTLANPITYSTDFTLGSPTTGNLTFTGAVNVGGGAKTFNVQNAVTTFSGVISGSGTVNRTKSGPGTLIFSGANTYTGTTVVSAGTLLLNNSTGSSAGTTNVTVSSGATFGGTGGLTGTVSVAGGGFLAPGASVESLATGTLTLSAGSTMVVEIDSSTGTTDVVNVTGDLSLAGLLNVTDIAGIPAALTAGTELIIATYTGTRTGEFSNYAEGASIVVGANTFTLSYAAANKITLTVTSSSPYDTWASGFGLDPLTTGAPANDFDKDGVKNVLEWVLGGNPAAADASILPTVAKTAGGFTFTFHRRDDSETDTALVFQYGNNLSGWTGVGIGAAGGSSGGVSYTVDEGTPATDPDTIVVTVPGGANTEMFGRLQATK